MKLDDLFMKDESYAIRGCLMDVHDQLPMFAGEDLYQEGLACAFADHHIPFEAQKAIQVNYRGHVLTHSFRLDFLCYGKIIIELKAVDGLLPVHFAQVKNYLSLCHLQLGFLVNFHSHPRLDIRRVYLDPVAGA